MNDELRGKTRLDPVMAAAIGASILGGAAFAYLFLRDLTVFWIVLAPVIFVVYQMPAFVLFRLAKKRRSRGQTRPSPQPPESEQVEDEE